MKKSVIMNPFTPVPKSDKSHTRGWALMWSQRLNADIATKDTDISQYEKIYIDHGVNFSGALNLFGGFSDEVFARCSNLMSLWFDAHADVYSLDHSIASCNYLDQIRKRIGANTTSKSLDGDFIHNMECMFSSTKTVTMQDLYLSKLIIGDSHSVAYSTSDQEIVRINGKTLYSALKQGLGDFISSHHSLSGIKEIELCLGSIDIRFHALRLNQTSAMDFASSYAAQVIQMQEDLGIPLSVCAPVPIEHEARRIPKTGQYDGKNFYGSREERLGYTLEFIETLEAFGEFNTIVPPRNWYTMSGEEYASEIMELSSSVHIAPKNYRSVTSWDKNDV